MQHISLVTDLFFHLGQLTQPTVYFSLLPYSVDVAFCFSRLL